MTGSLPVSDSISLAFCAGFFLKEGSLNGSRMKTGIVINIIRTSVLASWHQPPGHHPLSHLELLHGGSSSRQLCSSPFSPLIFKYIRNWNKQDSSPDCSTYSDWLPSSDRTSLRFRLAFLGEGDSAGGKDSVSDNLKVSVTQTWIGIVKDDILDNLKWCRFCWLSSALPVD